MWTRKVIPPVIRIIWSNHRVMLLVEKGYQKIILDEATYYIWMRYVELKQAANL